MHSIQQQFSFDINGNPVWGIGLGAYTNPSTTLDEIFNYLSSAEKPCLVAIDEYCVYDHFLQLWLQKQKYIR